MIENECKTDTLWGVLHSFLSKTFMTKWTSDFLFSCNDLTHFTNWYLAIPSENIRK